MKKRRKQVLVDAATVAMLCDRDARGVAITALLAGKDWHAERRKIPVVETIRSPGKKAVQRDMEWDGVFLIYHGKKKLAVARPC